MSPSERGPSSGLYAAIGVISTLLVIAAIVIFVLILRKRIQKSSAQHVNIPPEQTNKEMVETRDYDKLGDIDTDHYQELSYIVAEQPLQDRISGGYINQELSSAVTEQPT
jgi:uncharacterized membrane protein